MDSALLLREGLAALPLNLGRSSQNKLLHYLELLEKWNSVYNLTAIRDPADMVARLILDSLVIMPHLNGSRLVDVGTGAGLPGIPLAIACPDVFVSLLESRRKPTQFLSHVVTALGLSNVQVVLKRAEQYRPMEKFDTLTARAFGTVQRLLTAAGHLCRPHGRILALKGRYPKRELDQLSTDTFELVDVVPLRVPQLGAARHLVIMRPVLPAETGRGATT